MNTLWMKSEDDSGFKCQICEKTSVSTFMHCPHCGQYMYLINAHSRDIDKLREIWKSTNNGDRLIDKLTPEVLEQIKEELGVIPKHTSKRACLTEKNWQHIRNMLVDCDWINAFDVTKCMYFIADSIFNNYVADKSDRAFKRNKYGRDSRVALDISEHYSAFLDDLTTLMRFHQKQYKKSKMDEKTEV